MKSMQISWTVLVAVLGGSLMGAAPLLGAPKATKNRAAEKQVEEILQCEASQGTPDRAKLLKPLLEQEPKCEAAWWHSGFLFDAKRKEWLRWDEAQQMAAEDDVLDQYRETRAKYSKTDDGQAKLAAWCARHRLADEARAHWTAVLNLSPDHPDARRELGFQRINGTWVSRQEIDHAKQRAEEMEASIERWTLKLEKLLAKLDSKNQQASDRARRELMAIKDPDAVPAIEVLFCSQGDENALLGIELLKNMQAAEAAESLAWQAVYSPWEPVRTAATVVLKTQRKHDYVPLLLNGMSTPSQVRCALYDMPNGGFLMRWALYLDGPEQRKLMVSDVARPSVLLQSIKRADASQMGDPIYLKQRQQSAQEDLQRTMENAIMARMKAMAQARQQQAIIAAQNFTVSSRNSQLCFILAEATGDTQPKSPNDWYSWWNRYNEVTTPEDKPMEIVYQVYHVPVFTVAETPRLPYSCLAAGTLVWSELGPVAVEKVQAGDRVLACDCNTGQIALKPVLQTIVNPQKSLLVLHTTAETLEVTGGHVFWVSGKGWVKARELQPGMRFHTLTGTVDLESADASGQQDTYNLIVADSHTYFVGKDKILTHDNTIRRPTNCVVPGLAAHRASPSP